MTDEQGSFSMAGLPSGRWWVAPAVREELGIAMAEAVKVGAGDDHFELDLTFGTAYEVEGSVVDPDGAPLQARVIAYRPREQSSMTYLVTDEDGRFQMALVGDGYLLSAFDMKRRWAVPTPPVPVDPETGPHEVRLGYGQEIRVTVLAHGTPVEGAKVEIEPLERRVFYGFGDEFPQMTGPDGTLVLGGVPPGGYIVRAELWKGSMVGLVPVVTVREGEQDQRLVVELVEGGTVEVEVNEGTYRVDLHTPKGKFIAFPLYGPTLEVHLVPAGKLSIVGTPSDEDLGADGPPITREVIVEPGDWLEIDLDE